MRGIHFSPFLLAMLLTPVFLQTSTPLSCKSGDTTLSELAFIVEGEDQIVGFDPNVQSYAVSLPVGTDQALVHTVSTDPEARVWVDILVDDERLRYQHGGLGGGDLVVPLPKGESTLEVWVRPPGGATDVYAVSIEVGLPCAEDGLLEAIARGGGPHFFDCDEPIVTTQTIYILDDVKLDGLGTLVVSGANDHRVFSVENYATVELRGMTITDGGGGYQGSAVANFGGDLAIVDSTVSNSFRGGIVSSGTLTVVHSVITDNFDAWGGGGIVLIGGTMTMSDSVVSNNTSEWYGGIGIQPTTTMATIIRSEVTGNVATVYDDGGIGLGTGTALSLIDSTVSYNHTVRNGGGVGGAEADITVIGSTIVGNYAAFDSGGVGLTNGGTLVITNSTVTGNEAGHRAGGVAVGPGAVGFVTSTTVADNVAPLGPAIGTLDDITIVGSLIVGECGFLGPPPVVTNTVEGIPTGATFESTCFGSVVVPEVDLALQPLQDNGGPTETHAILTGSVAHDVIPAEECVDAGGAPLATDQRGLPRDSVCDAGAFEVQPQTGWFEQQSPTTSHLDSVSFADADNGWAVGRYGTILRTADGGRHWETQDSGLGLADWLVGVSFSDANTGTAVGFAGTILRTDNGGVSWVRQDSGTAERLYGVWMTDASTSTAVGVAGTILRTDDGGSTWVPQRSGTTNTLLDVWFLDADKGIAVGAGGTILWTNDRGTTWQARESGTTNQLRRVSFADADTGTVVSTATTPTILRTTDGGLTWEAQTAPSRTDQFYGVSFTDANTGTIVGPHHILRTEDGGTTWRLQLFREWMGLRDVVFTDTNTGIAVGTDGIIMRTLDGGG